MTVTRINLSQDYKQDEHQRMQQTLADNIDSNAARNTYSECRLGHVYVTSTTANQSQQCVEPQILVSGTGSNSGVSARYYWATMPFMGNVMSFQVDCTASFAGVHYVTLYKNGVALPATTLTVNPNAPNSYQTFSKGKIPFKPGDTFYAVVTFALATSSTFYCGFVKMYIQAGT